MPSDTGDPLSCSFCQKSQTVVRKLISSPSPPPRAYICNECITVCALILDDDLPAGIPMHPTGQPHPWLAHPLASPLMTTIERWIRQESLGVDAAEEIAEMRTLATRIMSDEAV